MQFKVIVIRNAHIENVSVDNKHFEGETAN
jgi:hypothetical protein